jgi:flagellar biosynthesis protein FliP
VKSGSLKLLEPSGPVQACNGIALHFTTFIMAFAIHLIYNAKVCNFERYANPEDDILRPERVEDHAVMLCSYKII